MTRLFTGDFSTGDFSQWPHVNNKDAATTGEVWRGRTYPAQIVSEDKDCGYACRFEVRTGDVPSFGGAERSEVSGTGVTEALDGSMTWYAFSIKFDESWPLNHHEIGWALVVQWHDSDGLYSPILSLGWKTPNPADGLVDGYWYLVQNQQNPAGTPIGTQLLLEMPLNVGQWHDIKMQVKASSDDATGFVRVWHNGEPQTLLGGSTTFVGQTMVPSVAGQKIQLGYYRQNDIPETGILYHTGFRMADSEDSL